MLHEQLQQRHDTSERIIDFQNRKPRFGLGEPLMICCLQAIKVCAETINNATFGDITAIIITGVRHFKAEPAILCSSGIYIDIRIKQVRHTNGFDLTKDELVKAGIGHYINNNWVTFVEWERI